MTINLSNIFSKLFVLSLIWILVEGVFRKWLLPSLTVQLFAVKYALFVLMYFIYFLQQPRLKKITNLYQLFIVLFIIWCLFQLVNNQLKAPLLVTIFGYINYLFFIPLFVIVPKYFVSISQIEKFVKIIAWISLPIYILGIIQYTLPADHFLNALANDEQGIATVSTLIRSNSVFTFVKNYNSYLLFSVSLFFCFLFYRLHKGKKISFYAILILLGVLNMFITASRLPVFLLAIFILFILAYILIQLQQLRKSILIISILSVFSLILFYSISETFKTSVDGFIYRVEFTEHVAAQGVENYSAKDRLTDRITIFKFSEEAGWLGFGIGTTYQGTGFFLSTKRSDIKYEEEGERIVLELGVIGGILTLLMRLFIFLYSLKFLFRVKNISFALLAMPLILQFIPPLFFLNSLTFSYIDCFIYWLCFGLFLSLENIYSNQNALEK